MGKYSFSIASPDEVEASPEALKYLERGADNFGGLLGVRKALETARHGQSIFVFVKNAIILRGAIYLTITHQDTGKVLTSVLFGGDNFDEWASELREYYYKLAKEHDCDEFSLLGRRGFQRFFPELKEVATVFRVILKAKP